MQLAESTSNVADTWAAAWAASAAAAVSTDPATVDTAAQLWAGRVAAATDTAAAMVPAERRAAARRSLEHFAVLAAKLALGTARRGEDPATALEAAVAQMIPALAARSEAVLSSLVEMTVDEEAELQAIAARTRQVDWIRGGDLEELADGADDVWREAKELAADEVDRAEAQRVLRDMGEQR